MNQRITMVTMIITVLILSGFVSPSGTRSQYGVSIECESREHYVEMEQYTYYLIKISNIGDSDDTYNLSMDSPPDHWQAELNVSEISIPTMDYRNVMLKVKSTCDCESGESLLINVTATSETDPSVFDSILIITTFASVKVVIFTDTDYMQLDRGESYTHKINVRNEGSERDTFWITVSESPELTTSLGSDHITLPSNTRGIINLTVTASASAFYGYHELNIGAESMHNSDEFEILTITIIVGKIELKVQNIELSKINPKEGDTVTISFDISNTGSVNARDLMITVYNLTKEGGEKEIGSNLISINPEEEVTIQNDIIYSSDFNGISIEAKIKGKYEIWQDSLTAKELGLEQEQEDEIPYFLIGLIIVILVVIVIIFLGLRKKWRE